MRRWLPSAAFLAALLAAFGSAQAQVAVRLPTGVTCGNASPTTGNAQLYIDEHGSLCTSASISGSVSVTSAADAAAAPPTVVAGSAKPINQSTHGEQWVSLSVGGTVVSLGAAGSNATAPLATQLMVSDNSLLQRAFAPIVLGDGVNGNNMLSVGSWLWNGATWDRTPGSAAGGLKVQAGTNLNTSALALESGGNLATLAGTVTASKVSVNMAQVAGTNTVTGGVNGSQGVGGLAASGATAAGNPILSGARAATTEPTAVTDGQAIAMQTTADGRLVTQPNSIPQLMTRGSVVVTGTGAQPVIAATGSALLNYITGLQCSNTSATTITVTANDSASSIFIVPAGEGTNVTFPTPLVVAGSAAFTLTASGATTTTQCNAQGFKGT